MEFQKKSFKERQAERHTKSLKEFPTGIASRRTVTPRLTQGLSEVEARQKREAAQTKTPEEQAAIEKEAAGPSQTFSAGIDQRPPGAFTTPLETGPSATLTSPTKPPGAFTTPIFPSDPEAQRQMELWASAEGKSFDQLSQEEIDVIGAAVPLEADDLLMFSPIGFTKKMMLNLFTKDLAKKGITVAANKIGGVTAKAAAGIAPKQGIPLSLEQIVSGKAVSAATKKIAANTKTKGLISSYLTKLVKGAVKPMSVLGLIGVTTYTSLFWGPNEKGDALVTLAIVQRDAVRNGDEEMVREIDELIQETLNIIPQIPIIGFYQAEVAKYKAAALASKTATREVERQRIKREKEAAAGITEEELETQKWEDIAAEREELRQQEREEDEAYFNLIDENRRIAKEEERAEDEAYWAKIATDKQAAAEKKRREDDAYWQKVNKAREENRKSTLKFGLLK